MLLSNIVRNAVFAVSFFVLFACAAPRSIYFGASDKNLYALNGKDGALRWKVPLGGEVHTTPLFWAGNVYVSASDGAVYAFSDDSGKLLWQTAVLTPQQASQFAPQSVLSTPVMGGIQGILFVATALGDVF